MARAESLYVDPSALLKLYMKEPESRAMTAWRGKIEDPLLVTHHGRVELINGIGLAAYRGHIEITRGNAFNRLESNSRFREAKADSA